MAPAAEATHAIAVIAGLEMAQLNSHTFANWFQVNLQTLGESFLQIAKKMQIQKAKIFLHLYVLEYSISLQTSMNYPKINEDIPKQSNNTLCLRLRGSVYIHLGAGGTPNAPPKAFPLNLRCHVSLRIFYFDASGRWAVTAYPNGPWLQ